MPAYLPGTGLPGQIVPKFDPYDTPVIPGEYMPAAQVATISTPLASPPQQFTNVETLINGGYLSPRVLLFINNRPITATAVLPGQSLPGTSLPGYAPAPYGRLLTEGLDYTISGGVVTMTVPPTGADMLTAVVFSPGRALGGPRPTRFVAPWQLPLPLSGLYDGVSTLYRVVFSRTIFGVLDGINKTFTWGVQVRKASIFVNGKMQTMTRSVSMGPTAMVFAATNIPQPGDIIFMLGYL